MNKYEKIGHLLRFARLARQLSTVQNKRPNFYELLGVSPKATAVEIKNAYFEKTKLYHPDVVTPTDESVSLFRQISEAYEVLGSAKLRKEYDKDVLGIWEEDDQDSDDPISAYKRKMADVRSYSWAQEHCNTLRKQQYTYNNPVLKHKVAARKQPPANPHYVTNVAVLLSITILIALQMNAFDNIKKIIL